MKELTYVYIANRINKVLCSSSTKQLPMAKRYCLRLVSRYKVETGDRIDSYFLTMSARETLNREISRY